MTVTSVVVGVDGSPEADDALVWALEEARLRGVPVHAVNVRNPGGGHTQGERLAAPRAVAEHRARIGDEFAAHVRNVVELNAATEVPVTTEVRYGRPTEELIHEACADALLVVGSRGRGRLAGSLLGSVSQSTIRYSRGPVVVVRGRRTRPAAARVVVGVDGSPGSVGALRFAHDAAVDRGATLRVLHAWTLPYMGFAGAAALPQEAIDDLSAQAAATLRDTVRRAGVDETRAPVETRLVQGPPAPALLEAAENADLLVVGSRGHGGWKGLLPGSVSARSAVRATSPVAVVRADGERRGVPSRTWGAGEGTVAARHGGGQSREATFLASSTTMATSPARSAGALSS
ncbi:universal stress protein [Actinoplanes sp. NPDC049668]|uniref:universal stress protein n=1 Tax=unclassified Actinoplanes TaxID=2626549 RepID=UPI0033BE7291